jgi:geranylgeranyl diphosphate synthase type II
MSKQSGRGRPPVSRFNIHDYLRDRRSLIDRALQRYLQAPNRYPPTLYRAMHYGLFSGGKRLRPILTLAAGELFGARRDRLLPFACALELIHTYSLIHDDLPALDNDDLRRGEPASHKVFGEGVALLAGDALLTEAFHLMTRPAVVRLLKPALVVELVREISCAAGVNGLVGGQVVDLEAEGREVDVATVERIHVRKTGALIRTAASVGARIGGARPGEMRKISRYSESLGLAFQIADDIQDVQRDVQGDVRGAAQGSAHGPCDGLPGGNQKAKATYPAIVGMSAAREKVRALLQRALRELESFGAAADPLRGLARCVVEPVVQG